VNQGDHPVIPHVDQLDRLGLVVVKGVDPILHVGAQGVLAMDRPTIVDAAFSGAVVDVLGPVVDNAVDSLASEGIECGPNHLNVLLRHRVRSISALDPSVGPALLLSRESDSPANIRSSSGSSVRGRSWAFPHCVLA
jgi:hypothetical protein